MVDGRAFDETLAIFDWERKPAVKMGCSAPNCTNIAAGKVLGTSKDSKLVICQQQN